MNLYIDDDSVDRRLVAMLGQAGHDVVIPADAGLSGQTDARHLVYALRANRVMVTRNYDDFRDLHELVHEAQGQHEGMLVIRSDNDPGRDMTRRQIVVAIGRLAAAGVPIANELYILNHWR